MHRTASTGTNILTRPRREVATAVDPEGAAMHTNPLDCPRRLMVGAAVLALTVVLLPASSSAAGPAAAAAAPPAAATDHAQLARTDVEVLRVSGTGRIETAVAISELGFPFGAERVYLARADVFADALTAGPVAAAADRYLQSIGGPGIPAPGPILLVPPCGPLPPVVAQEIDRVDPDRVVALGGTAAVCDDLLSTAAEGRSTARLSGPTRFDTAGAIAEEGFAVPHQFRRNRVYLANHDDSPDAVAGASLSGGPILLTPRDGALPDPTRMALELRGPDEVVALGGQAAVSDDVLRAAADLVGAEAVRLSGPGRVETAVAIARDQFVHGAARVHLARADVFADAIAAGSLVGGPVLLVPSCGDLPDAVADAIADLAPNQIVGLGGTAAICDDLLDEARAVAQDAEGPRVRLAGLGADGRIGPENAFFIAPQISDDGRYIAFNGGQTQWRDTWTGQTMWVDPLDNEDDMNVRLGSIANAVYPDRVVYAGDDPARDDPDEHGVMGQWERRFDERRTVSRLSGVDGALLDDDVWGYGVSDDGSRTVIETAATNAVDDGAAQDITIVMIEDGEVSRVSLGPDGDPGDPDGQHTSMVLSGDGTTLFWEGRGISVDGPSSQQRMYARDLDTGDVTVAGTNPDGEAIAGSTVPLATTADASLVAFSTLADNALGEPDDDLGAPNRQTYVKDRDTGDVVLLSETPDSTRHIGESAEADLTRDGRYAVFTMASPTLAAAVSPDGEASEHAHLYLRDLQTGELQILDLLPDGSLPDGSASWPRFSGSGDRVIFASEAADLIGGPIPDFWDEGVGAVYTVDLDL